MVSQSIDQTAACNALLVCGVLGSLACVETSLGFVRDGEQSYYLWVHVPHTSNHISLLGIVSIMSKATSRLEGRQDEKYRGQEKYDTWVRKVKAPLFPGL